MGRTFIFGQSGLEQIDSAATGKGPDNVVIASENGVELMDNPNYSPTLNGPSNTPTSKPTF